MVGWDCNGSEESEDSTRKTIETALMELIEKARSQKKIIVVEYQNLRYFPNEFEKIVFENHRFLWGINNFKLESPSQYINECDEEIARLQIEKANFNVRMATGF